MTMPDLCLKTLPLDARASWMRRVLRGAEGVRAGWQEWPKTLARLQRITAKVLGSRWRLTLQRLPDLLGRERHVEMAHAERRQRIEHGIGEHHRGAVGRQLADALEA